MDAWDASRATGRAGWGEWQLDGGGSFGLSPRGRAIVGAFYGLLIGVAYSLVAGTIDVLALRDVPLQVSWATVWPSVAFGGLGAALLGAIAAWPASALRGVIAGALAMAAWGMVRALALSGTNAALLTFTLVPAFLPTAMLSLPVAVLLRWAVNLHEANSEKTGRGWLLSQAGLVLGLAALAAFAGSWAQMPDYAQDAVRQVDRIVYNYLSSPEDTPLPLALRNVPDLREKAGRAYWLEQYPAAASPTAVEVGVYFDNGYAVTCLVDAAGSVPSCYEGSHLFSGQYNANDQR